LSVHLPGPLFFVLSIFVYHNEYDIIMAVSYFQVFAEVIMKHLFVVTD